MAQKKKSIKQKDFDNWIELHRHFSDRWHRYGERTWETIKLNIVLVSALTSLTVYSIIYVYTSEFFWETDALTSGHRLWVRVGLILIPMLMFLVNWMFHRIFSRQCRRMYEVASVLIKIQEKIGLYVDRSEKEHFPNDKWYVTDDWKKLGYYKSKDYVDSCMNEKDRHYKNTQLLFVTFAVLAIFLSVLELILL